MKPLIGITADTLQEMNRDWLWQTHDYFRALQAAGAIPVMLPYITTAADAAEILSRVDGVLFTGGNDVDPLLYGEEPVEKMGSIQPDRDTAELVLARAVLDRNLPILGICRGHQLLAVAEGGTLWQDIPSQVKGAIKHSYQAPTPKWYPTHTVRLEPGTKLAALFGSELKINSRHHQAVKAVPAGWVAAATAPDGVNEAMEKPSARFAVTVQWHPESMVGQAFNYSKLFEAFVAAAAQR